MNTTQAKQDILGRLRRRMETTPSSEPDLSFMAERNWSIEDRIERLTRQLESVHGEVIRTSKADLAETLFRRMEQSQARSLLLGGNCTFQEALEKQCPESVSLNTYETPIEGWKTELFTSMDAALTTTRGAIADTGSLILWPTPDEPRLMSLVPPLHFAIVETKHLYNTWLEAMRTQQWHSTMPTNALLVSGPSKTADIEQTLVYGAHGPMELVVLLID